MLDDITLYWLTNSAISSAQLYWENNANNFNAVDISIPAAVTIFPGEIYRAPRSWTERSTINCSSWLAQFLYRQRSGYGPGDHCLSDAGTFLAYLVAGGRRADCHASG